MFYVKFHHATLILLARLRDWNTAQTLRCEMQHMSPCPASRRTYTLLVDVMGWAGKGELAIQVSKIYSCRCPDFGENTWMGWAWAVHWIATF